MEKVYVDSQGYAHDDENNRWFVGTGYPEGHYNYRSLPKPSRPKPQGIPVDNTAERRAFSAKLLLAALAQGDAQAAEFLGSTFYRVFLSEAQVRYRASIESRYRSLAARMPEVSLLNVTEKRSDVLVENLSDSTVRRLEPFFAVESLDFGGRARLKSLALWPELRKKGPSPLQEAQSHAIRTLYDRTRNNFLRTVLLSLEDGVTPSTRQMDVVRKIFSENGEPIPEILRG